QAKLVIDLRATLLPLRLYLATALDRLRAEALGLAADARSAGRRSAEAAAQVTLGEVAWLQDDLDTAEGHFATGNRLSLEVGFTRKRLWSLLGLAQVAIELTTQPDGTADVEAELHLAEAVRLLDEALVQARRAGQVKLVIELRATLLPPRLYLATPLDRLRAEALGLAADAHSAGRRSAEAAAQVTLGEVAWLQDDLEAAEGHLAAGNRLSLEVGFTRKRLWSLLGLAQVAIARGQPEAARRLAQEAIELTTQPDGTADVEAELHLAEACLAGGDLGEAAAAVARAWAVLQEVDVFSRARLQRTEARLAMASGDPAGAVALLERSLAALEATGHRLDRLHSLIDLARALRQAGRDDEAEATAKGAGDQAAAMGAHALVRRLAGDGVPGPAASRAGGDGR
ncbi:MAG TPA: hypothetical protein VG411_11865, partial [Actinomycetota bacterium]|nr:hypothetical protein [Actinomycetota bacterium]